MLRFFVVTVLTIGLCFPSANAKSQPTSYIDAQNLQSERVAGPFEYPWSLEFLPDGRMLVTEKTGALKLVAPGQKPATIAGLPKVRYGNQGGLLDVVVAPDFAKSRTLFLSYSHADGYKIRVRVLRAKLDLAALRLLDKKVIFESGPPGRSGIHFGGRMVVTPFGDLFLSLGERGERDRSQDLSDHAGSVVRIDLNGQVPQDNPFRSRSGAKPEIWSFGHRNPQGMAFDAVTGDIWLNEHGPRGGDELNRVIAGHNYGWPLVSYGINYSGTPVGSGQATAPGVTPPVHYWVPSIATSGLAIIREGQTISFWNGGLIGQVLARVTMTPDGNISETRFLRRKVGRIRDVRYGPDGKLYILTDSSRGYLYRLHAVD